MSMHIVIQNRRKELGLTQQQIAEYLNISTPAVNKWEKGITCPDISVLPQLARLLKIDLNTLFGFHENMTRQDISCFCRELSDAAQMQGIAIAFETAQQKIHEYPYDEVLLHCATIQLDGLLSMSSLPPDEKKPFDDIIAAWYHRLSESNDTEISNSANYMIAGRHIREGSYDKAQQTLDFMPDRIEIADKLMLQVSIYQHQGQTEKAAEELERALFQAINRVQLLLYKLIDAELAAGQNQRAKFIADKSQQMAKLFDLWAYNASAAHFQIAVFEKNTNECMDALKDMLEAMLMLSSWNMDKSPLFCRIAKSIKLNDPKQMLPVILSEMERDASLSFLQDNDEFKPLLAKYKSFAALQ